MWKRIGPRLPWVAAQCVSTHWLRHTTLTWVERNSGFGIARAYAGHTDSTGPATTTYIKADLQAVATALAGEPHPLAATPRRTRHPRLTSAPTSGCSSRRKTTTMTVRRRYLSTGQRSGHRCFLQRSYECIHGDGHVSDYLR
jgi:hypothetical protein